MDNKATAFNEETELIGGIREITAKVAEKLLKEKILQLSSQPEFQWKEDYSTFEQDPDGSPAVRVAVASCPVDFDLWAGLRNPAKVGIYPVGTQEIWEYYAGNREKRTDAAGRATIFQLAEPFEEA